MDLNIRYHNELMKDATEPPSHGLFLLSVMYSTTRYPRRLLVSPDETIADLKAFCAPWLHAYMDELDVFIRRDFPYPLSDDMVLGMLHEEHRTLFLHLHDPSCRSIPLRFLHEEKGEKRILDLTTLPVVWNKHVERWLHEDPLFHEIMVDGTREETDEILYTLGEIVRYLPMIQRIQVKGHPLRVSADAVAYVRYHLAMDQYRSDQVNLTIDDVS